MTSLITLPEGEYDSRLLDESNHKILVAAFKSGLKLKQACSSARITLRQYDDLLELAREAYHGGQPDHPAIQQVLDVEEAKTDFASEMLQNIRLKSGDDWRAAAWLLEKHTPEDYGKAPATQVDVFQVNISAQGEGLGAEQVQGILTQLAQYRTQIGVNHGPEFHRQLIESGDEDIIDGDIS